MNGSSSLSSPSQVECLKSDQDGDEWSQEDCLTLLERIRSLLPEGDSLKYKTTESHIDWDKVCFGAYSSDMCKQKWLKVSTVVRKFRTMTELIIEAMEKVKNPYKGKKLKTHPDFPKKPLTPYFRFFMEKRAKYAKIHPEMSNLDLTKILSKKYKELPEKKKLKYMQDFQEEKESFKKNMARFKEEHPDLIQERKKSDIPEKPKTPQQLWYNHEKKTYMKLHPDVSQKELKEALRRQWSQLSDKKRLKWISKALELQKDYEDRMKAYLEAHPECNAEEHVKSVLTKAERQLKDKFDGRPTKPPPNGYSLYCAELMVNMKDVPSTERMVLCSKRWKTMSQREKDMFQKRCEQKKKQYEIDLQRFLESLPEEERDRVLTEEKLGGSRLGVGNAGSPHRAKSPSGKERYREADNVPDQRVQSLVKDKHDGKKRVRLPETPKTAEEMWQQSVIGDYLAKYRNDRKKAQNAMESTWKAMEKKEKIPWIKKAAEDQKRYEVYQYVGGLRHPMTQVPVPVPTLFSVTLFLNSVFSNFLVTVTQRAGFQWCGCTTGAALTLEGTTASKVLSCSVLFQSLTPQERAVYKEFTSTKRRSSSKAGGPGAKVRVPGKGKAVGASARGLGAGGGRRALAYRSQETSDSEEEEKTDSSDSEEEEETSGSSESEEDEEEDEDDDEDEDDQSEATSSSSTEESSDSDSD
uniref:Upstream binding transcription factor, like n=1 Tax=Lepisosteus oculatus TaxID=7918 RepID=W5MVX2_LEPOC